MPVSRQCLALLFVQKQEKLAIQLDMQNILIDDDSFLPDSYFDHLETIWMILTVLLYMQRDRLWYFCLWSEVDHYCVQ